MLPKFVLDMAMPLAEKYLEKLPSGLKSLAQEYGQEEIYLMVRNKVVPSEKDPNILVDKAFFCVMGIVDGKFAILSKDGKPAEYGIDKSGLEFLKSKIKDEE